MSAPEQHLALVAITFAIVGWTIPAVVIAIVVGLWSLYLIYKAGMEA